MEAFTVYQLWKPCRLQCWQGSKDSIRGMYGITPSWIDRNKEPTLLLMAVRWSVQLTPCIQHSNFCWTKAPGMASIEIRPEALLNYPCPGGLVFPFLGYRLRDSDIVHAPQWVYGWSLSIKVTDVSPKNNLTRTLWNHVRSSVKGMVVQLDSLQRACHFPLGLWLDTGHDLKPWRV
jgi:hypothetical protein